MNIFSTPLFSCFSPSNLRGGGYDGFGKKAENLDSVLADEREKGKDVWIINRLDTPSEVEEKIMF